MTSNDSANKPLDRESRKSDGKLEILPSDNNEFVDKPKSLSKTALAATVERKSPPLVFSAVP